MSQICQHCQAKMIEYTFTFNKGLAKCLWLLRDTTGPVEIKKLSMTRSQWTNFQKLRYWTFIAPVLGENAKKGGYWKITEAGKRFLQGRIQVPKKVVMYRNQFVRFEGEKITFDQVNDGYLYRGDYRDQAREQLQESP